MNVDGSIGQVPNARVVSIECADGQIVLTVYAERQDWSRGIFFRDVEVDVVKMRELIFNGVVSGQDEAAVLTE